VALGGRLYWPSPLVVFSRGRETEAVEIESEVKVDAVYIVHG
jgi:hypothetical protein